MFVCEDRGKTVGECVVTDEGGGVLEIKNPAVYTRYQRRGYGKSLIEFVTERFHGKFSVLQVGTGDSPLTIPFYEHCGFSRYSVIGDFFTDNYDHSIYEAGIRLKDMIILRNNI